MFAVCTSLQGPVLLGMLQMILHCCTGEFWLVDRMTAEQTTEAAGGSKAGKARLCLFCEHSWDRLTGSLLPLVI